MIDANKWKWTSAIMGNSVLSMTSVRATKGANRTPTGDSLS